MFPPFFAPSEPSVDLTPTVPSRGVRVKLIDGSTVMGVVSAELADALVIDCSLGHLSILDLGIAVGCATVVFALGALAFAVGAFGGGDVKLLAAASLFAGPALLPDLLLVTAFVGGALGCAIAVGVPIGPQMAASGATLATRLRGGLPYGPAIAAGGFWTILTLATA